MKVIYETQPTPITLIYRGTGPPYRGFGRLEVILYEPDEEPPLVPGTTIHHTVPRPLSQLRGPDGRVVAEPGPSFRNSMSPIVIPDSVLTGLPDTARLFFGWLFTPGAP